MTEIIPKKFLSRKLISDSAEKLKDICWIIILNKVFKTLHIFISPRIIILNNKFKTLLISTGPKESRRVPSRPRASPSPDVPYTKPGTRCCFVVLEYPGVLLGCLSSVNQVLINISSYYILLWSLNMCFQENRGDFYF